MHEDCVRCEINIFECLQKKHVSFFESELFSVDAKEKTLSISFVSASEGLIKVNVSLFKQPITGSPFKIPVLKDPLSVSPSLSNHTPESCCSETMESI